MTIPDPLALAREYAKPVAWMIHSQADPSQTFCTSDRAIAKGWAEDGWRVDPLYTDPPVAQPLGDEQIQEIWRKVCMGELNDGPGWNRHIRFARALLSASASDAGGKDE